MSIGERIRAVRLAKGMTIRELAQRSHTTTGYIGDLEQGRRRNLTVESVQRIAAGLGVGAGSLIDGPPTDNDIAAAIAEYRRAVDAGLPAAERWRLALTARSR